MEALVHQYADPVMPFYAFRDQGICEAIGPLRKLLVAERLLQKMDRFPVRLLLCGPVNELWQGKDHEFGPASG